MLRRPLPDRLLAHLPFFLGDGRVPPGPGEVGVGGTALFQRRDASRHFAAEPAPVVVTSAVHVSRAWTSTPTRARARAQPPGWTGRRTGRSRSTLSSEEG